MPASLLTDLNSNGGGLEDQRALQLALELTMLGIGNGNTTDEVDGSGSYSPTMSNFEDFNKLGRKSSANMTECVPVPSSEHVAEIVGRQGCKIKALRAKTNTYIKTPVRGEEPVFVVTGRKEDVCAAKREILSAADHFSQIRASRRNNANGLAPGPPNPSAPGQVTIQVRVPYRVVGLVVGPKGATIKRIQQQTHTYIVTPSRDKEPIFEVTGLPENVEKSRQQIEAHIAMRTGGLMDSKTIDEFNDFHSNGIDTGLDMNSDFINGGFFKGLSSNSAFSSYNALNTLNSNNLLNQLHQDNIFSFPSMNSSKISDYSSISTNGFSNGFSIYDSDEGFASPTFAQSTLGSSVWTDATMDNSNVTIFGSTSTTTSLPERSSSLGDTPCITPPLTETTNHPTVRRLSSDPINGGISAYTSLPNCAFIPTSACSSLGGSSISTSPTSSTGSSHSHYACIMCPDPSSASTFMPCGQHRLCVECANLMIKKPESDRRCPICN